jgi:hypothetical protein
MTSAAHTRPARTDDMLGAVIVYLINAISTAGRERHVCADLAAARKLVAHYNPYNNTRIDAYTVVVADGDTTTIEPCDLRGVAWCGCGDPDGSGCTVPAEPEPEPPAEPEVGDVVTYHGSITAEHFSTFYVREVIADGWYVITDLDYPAVTTLRPVRRASITPTGERIEVCECGHDMHRATRIGTCAAHPCECPLAHDDTNT